MEANRSPDRSPPGTENAVQETSNKSPILAHSRSENAVPEVEVPPGGRKRKSDDPGDETSFPPKTIKAADIPVVDAESLEEITRGEHFGDDISTQSKSGSLQCFQSLCKSGKFGLLPTTIPDSSNPSLIRFISRFLAWTSVLYMTPSISKNVEQMFNELNTKETVYNIVLGPRHSGKTCTLRLLAIKCILNLQCCLCDTAKNPHGTIKTKHVLLDVMGFVHRCYYSCKWRCQAHRLNRPNILQKRPNTPCNTYTIICPDGEFDMLYTKRVFSGTQQINIENIVLGNSQHAVFREDLSQTVVLQDVVDLTSTQRRRARSLDEVSASDCSEFEQTDSQKEKFTSWYRSRLQDYFCFRSFDIRSRK